MSVVPPSTEIEIQNDAGSVGDNSIKRKPSGAMLRARLRGLVFRRHFASTTQYERILRKISLYLGESKRQGATTSQRRKPPLETVLLAIANLASYTYNIVFTHSQTNSKKPYNTHAGPVKTEEKNFRAYVYVPQSLPEPVHLHLHRQWYARPSSNLTDT